MLLRKNRNQKEREPNKWPRNDHQCKGYFMEGLVIQDIVSDGVNDVLEAQVLNENKY